MCTTHDELISEKQQFKVKSFFYWSDCAETEESESIIGDMLQLRFLYISPETRISFLSHFN